MRKNFLPALAALLPFMIGISGGADTQVPSAQKPPPHFQGTVQTPDGKPAAGVTVALDIVDGVAHVLTGSATAVTKADGAFDLPMPQVAAPQSAHPLQVILYGLSPAGVAVTGVTGNNRALVIEPFTQVRVRFVDAENRPVAHLLVAPQYFTSQHAYGRWDRGASPQWTETTDAQGYAEWTKLPQGISMQLGTDDARFAQMSYDNQVTLANGPVTPPQTIHLQRGGAVTGLVRYGATGQPAPGMVIEAVPGQQDNHNEMEAQPSGPDGKFEITRIAAGTYSLQLKHPWNDTSPWTAAAQTVTVTAGGQVIVKDIKVVKGSLLTGTVTDKATGKPVAGVQIWANGPSAPDGFRNQIQTASGPDGSYSLRVAPGVQTVNFFSPGTNEGNPTQNVTVAEGQTQTLDLQAAAPVPPLEVRGVVVGPDGKPVPNAQVVVVAGNTGDLDAQADTNGHFDLTGQQVMPGSLLLARSGDLATARPTTLTAPATSDITLTLAPNVLTTFTGRVTDTDGKTLAHVKVNLNRGLLGSGNSIGCAVAYTDSRGRYAFPPDFAGAQYSVDAEASGYAIQFSRNVTAAPGKTVVIAPLRVVRADSFVGGTVVDPQGKPIAGASISVADVPDLHQMTDAKGRFHFTGVPRKQVILDVTAPQGRFINEEVASGSNNTVLRAMSYAEEVAESKRMEAQMDADKTNHGDGTNAHLLLRRAEAQAAASKRAVLLVFHASWCGPCFMLHRFLEDPQVKPIIAKHFVVQDIDIWEKGAQKPWENPGGTNIYKQYGGPNSVPFFVALTPQGTKIGDAMHDGQNMGVPTEPGDVAAFFAVLRRAAPSMTPADFAVLRAGLARDVKI